MSVGIELVEVCDDDFEWMLGRKGARNGLTLAKGGVDDRAVLTILRAMTVRLHEGGSYASWMVTCNAVVVGLCSYKRPPSGGCTEIGYGIAPSQRGKGYATQAVALMIEIASADPSLDTLTAETAVTNLASQVVLQRNGFTQTGTRFDAEDGEVTVWGKHLR